MRRLHSTIFAINLLRRALDPAQIKMVESVLDAARHPVRFMFATANPSYSGQMKRKVTLVAPAYGQADIQDLRRYLRLLLSKSSAS
jgi:hypothetical protein